jgi:hypothetical protein
MAASHPSSCLVFPVVSTNLQPAVFAPSELVTLGYLYVIHKGVAAWGGKVLTSGGVFGQDMILRRQSLCRLPARAMSYLEVYRISRAQLLDVAKPFPVASTRIKFEALRLAIHRLAMREMEKQSAETSDMAEQSEQETIWATSQSGQKPSTRAIEIPPTMMDLKQDIDGMRADVAKCADAVTAMAANMAPPEVANRSPLGASKEESIWDTFWSPAPPLAHQDRTGATPVFQSCNRSGKANAAVDLPVADGANILQSLIRELHADQKAMREELRLHRVEAAKQREVMRAMTNDLSSVHKWIIDGAQVAPVLAPSTDQERVVSDRLRA